LIKDQKEINDNNTYPTKLVAPATNFTLVFSKLGYIGVKKIMDNAEINYSRKSIIQASHLKLQIESLEASQKISTQYSDWISRLSTHWPRKAWLKE
jgi:hypothetical protein